MDYKQEFLEAVIQGLVEGGYPEDAAKGLWKLFEKIYDSGYNEGQREQYVNSLHWSRQ